MKYRIAMHRTDEGISVSVPALPGCWSEGDTEEEALVSIQDAIREYLAASRTALKVPRSARSRWRLSVGPNSWREPHGRRPGPRESRVPDHTAGQAHRDEQRSASGHPSPAQSDQSIYHGRN